MKGRIALGITALLACTATACTPSSAAGTSPDGGGQPLSSSRALGPAMSQSVGPSPSGVISSTMTLGTSKASGGSTSTPAGSGTSQPVARPVISGVRAYDITATEAKITWTLDQPATGQVEYGTTPAYGQLSLLESSYQYSIHVQQLSGLLVATHYHYRVHSVNAAGGSAVSGDYEFTTLSSGSETPLHAPPPTSSLVVNVRDTGARCDGVTDDSNAIQAAIDQVAGTGGTVLVPDGTCLVQSMFHTGALHWRSYAVHLGSDMTFKMTGGAVLKMMPNGEEAYNVLYLQSVSNVNIIGGTMQGERHQHLTPGNDAHATALATPGDPRCLSDALCYGQWGYGVGIYESHNVFVEGVTAKDMWGDGFCIYDDQHTPIAIALGAPSTNITFSGVVAQGNRRQGLSIGAGDGILVTHSDLSNTHGHLPECGIDIEPDTGDSVNNVQILNSHFLGNAKCGISTFAGAAPVTNVTLDGNTVLEWAATRPQAGGNGIEIAYANGQRITNNHVEAFSGIDTNASTGNVITGNTLCAPNPITKSSQPMPANNDGNTISGNVSNGAGCP